MPIDVPVYHATYIAGSLLAALIASVGIWIDSPALYGIVPGVIGGIMALVAAARFFRTKTDLAGFVATFCGFVYYQAYQANPVMLPDFAGYLIPIPKQDQVVGIALANLTTAMLLAAKHAVSGLFGNPIGGFVPATAAVSREKADGVVAIGFWVVFTMVAVPNVLFGKVVVGAIRNVIYQRLSWSGDPEFSGFEVWGGPVGGSIANMALWASSLFLFWLYLLKSRHRVIMIVLSPLILIWTASVVLQGSRTYLVTMAVAVGIYVLGNPKTGARAFVNSIWAIALLFVLIQVSTVFRGEGLKAVNLSELSSRLFEVSGNEGASSEMDGIEYFRTELLARGTAPNAAKGFVRGIVERPIEGLLMPFPRPLFPWKPFDDSASEYNLFYENVRLGANTSELFLGASPGLIGRELIRYGFLGPITLLFWMGLVLALADQLYAVGAGCDFHRIFAAALIAFFVAQARDFVGVWFIPFLPALAVLAAIAYGAGTAVPSNAPASAGRTAGKTASSREDRGTTP